MRCALNPSSPFSPHLYYHLSFAHLPPSFLTRYVLIRLHADSHLPPHSLSFAPPARFRVKKKQKTLNLERTVSDLTGRVEELEQEASDLRRENGWLKEIVTLKSKQTTGQLLSSALASGSRSGPEKKNEGGGAGKNGDGGGSGGGGNGSGSASDTDKGEGGSGQKRTP